MLSQFQVYIWVLSQRLLTFSKQSLLVVVLWQLMKTYRKEKKRYYLMMHLRKKIIAAINLIAGKLLHHLIIWKNITKNGIEKSSCVRRIGVKNAIIIFKRRVKKLPMKFFTSINEDEIVLHLAKLYSSCNEFLICYMKILFY